MPKHPVPVFPLPGVVLFPGVPLPLHVFELRYRTLVRDALSSERVIALALLRQGWERDDHGDAEFHPLGCLAQFDEVRWLPDDCYDLRLMGVTRVRLGRTTREFPYRAVRVEVLPQHPFSEDDPLVTLERRALLEASARLARIAAAGAGPPELARPPAEGEPLQGGPSEPPKGGEPPQANPRDSREESLSFEPLVNSVCMALTVEPAERLALLEMDSVLERSRRARELIEEQVRWARTGDRLGGERN